MLADNPDAFDAALAERLMRAGKLEAQALERARRVRGEGGGLIELLPKLGLLPEREVAAAAAETLGLPLLGPRDYPAAPLLDGKVSPRFLRARRLLPVAEDERGVAVAMADPLDRQALDAIRLAASGAPVRACVGVPAEIEAALERLYGEGQTAGGLPNGVNGASERNLQGLDGHAAVDPSAELDIERLKDLASEAPVIRFVNQLIADAAERRASDIHIEPFEGRLRIRYRIDGVLREMEPPPVRLRAAILSRVKIMARLNIAERRLPQDGRINIAIRGVPIDLRVATMPTLHGEAAVLRLLDRRSAALDFKALGMAGESLDRYLRIVEQPHGVVLMTGPTGSGKTTTLYASLQRLNTPDRKILTVEDPVEYQLEGINQIQVKPSIGLTFAHVLRGFLRHDPDIIMVGEIRDAETAEIAVHAALTGHLVLSTLHTNSAASSVTRLLDMGVQDYLITSTVNGIAAQRLVRTLCTHCRRPYAALPELVQQLGLRRYANGASEVTLYRTEGCEHCQGTGFFGRTSLLETLIMTDPIRRLVLRHAEAGDIHRASVEEGMRTLYDDGMIKALAGVTTVEEVLRVTRDGDIGSPRPVLPAQERETRL